MGKWSEIRSEHIDEDGVTFIDGWRTEDENEEGVVIALIDSDGDIEYVDKDAKTDNYAQEIIQEIISLRKEEKKKLSEKALEQIIIDVGKGDFTAIEQMLLRTPINILNSYLPEK
jgi:uncharacterized protein (UPF0335 family)